MKTRTVVLTVLAVSVMCGPVWADELNVPYEYPTIQAAIDAANDGDAVIVSGGPYNEDISFNGKNIIVTTPVPCYPGVVDGPLIQGTGTGPVVAFAGSEDANCGLFGFVITGGNSSGEGGGICGNGTAARIAYCFIRDNHAEGSGGGLGDCDGGIGYCIIRDNTATGGGGLSNCDGPVVNCLITNNSSDGDGGGMVCSGNSTVVNCTIVGNSAGVKGGGMFCTDTSVVAATNSILWGNTALFGPQTYNFGGSVVITYSDVQGGHAGEGNIDSDPLFVAPGIDNYHLEPFSPCIDVGDNNGVPPSADWDLDGNPRIVAGRVDMGAYEFQGVVRYVDGDANGANDGSSWANAYNYLQDALRDANSACGPVEIRVAQGTHKANDGIVGVPEFEEQSLSFQLINGVVIKGGYAGFGEPDPNARDIKAYETILSGDLNGDDVVTADPNVLLEEPTRVDNSYHVVTGHNTDETAVLDGFTIKRGNFNVICDFGPCGGAGLYNDCGSPRVTNCTFTENAVLGAGGAMFNEDNSNPMLINCTFDRNAAGNGGGICGCSPTIANCTFSENFAWGGGALSDCSGLITKCTFSENSAGRGGALAGCNGVISRCTFYGNLAHEDGGAIDAGYWNSLTVENCVFRGNCAGGNGGCLFIYYDSSATLRNCSFCENSASNGRVLVCYTWHPEHPPSSVELMNCILWDGGDEIWKNDSSTIAVTYGDVQGGYPGEGNIDVNPLFAGGDDCHLLAGSLCIDAGDPNYTGQPGETDLDGNPRIVNGTVDMGAYEHQGAIYVDDDAPADPGPGDPNVSDPLENGSQAHPFDAIQEAIDAAESTDAVIVAEGTYCENIEFKGKNIILSSTNPVDDDVVGGTVIDGGEANSVVTFCGTENSSCVLRGFTITNGYALDGGGICGNGTMATIQHNVIRGNIAERSELFGGQGRGGGLYDCDGLIEKNVVMANEAGGGAGAGGGLYGCDGIIANCLISGNGAITGGGICTGGDMFDPGVPTIVNCTFSDNSAVYGGAISCGESSYVTVVSSVLWGDSAANGPEVAMTSVSFGSHLSVRFSNMQGGQAAIYDKDSLDWGPGNIDGDPLFADADANDYHLLVGSPCINAGDPNYTSQPDETDLDGNPRIVTGRVDMGAYEFQGVIYVDDDAPGDPGPGDPNVSDPLENGTRSHPFDSIQEAIDITFGWESVAVYPGIYEEGIDFLGKAITVAGTAGAATIEATGGYAVSFHYGEDANSVFKNFVVRNSYAGFLFSSSSPTITNVTVADNNNGALAEEGAQPDISNCIFWNNTEEDLFQCQARYSCIQRGGEGLGNISSDPLFVNPANGDYHLKSEGWRWAGSGWTWDEVTTRCIDAGNPGLDLGDEPMTIPRDPNNDYGINLRINMGAYGGTSQASMPPHGWALLADLNNDGMVNWPDLAGQLEDWLSSASEQPGDLNRDGFIDAVDYSMLAAEWTQVTGWIEFANFAEYWPFAVGNRWDSETMPDAGFALEVTDRFFVNGFEIWEFTNWFGTFYGGEIVTSYYVYVDGMLYATENLSDLDSLPEISGGLRPHYPEVIPVGGVVSIRGVGMTTVRRGDLASVLEGTGFAVEDFPLGYQSDVIAFISLDGEHVIVFARGLGPMRIIFSNDFCCGDEFFIASATVVE
ncbi:MAG TPA: choice-of-anchor Q domain-containing protein [Sedimentisphaerales bacterium]|nr:choice-of-anchor Q domain-containing protein [Sedimentisphaerales bacterium]